ncbi:MAG: restriction endonuclease subunit M [Lachnospiraceae bacterium]|nr:restriction endonuclease subunit M [Lachnospiraceae bacterium]
MDLTHCLHTHIDLSPQLMAILLKDRTTDRNIFWATDSYSHLGAGYQFFDEITLDAIDGPNGNVIIPRALKPRQLQQKRSKKMAEVFTPSWVCNNMNNLVDNAWFGREDVFSSEIIGSDNKRSWANTQGKIEFPEGKAWTDYVSENRLEITCGEAPFLVSRYDTVTGEFLPVERRIGLLDRKLRIARENTSTPAEWLKAAKSALRSTYGYEWQGDNIVIARGNMLFTMMEHYQYVFQSSLPEDVVLECAEIISWNIWQMDGLKMVIPCSCHDEEISASLFGDSAETKPCPGCKKKDYWLHNGIYAKIMDWEAGRPTQFVSILKKNK